MKVKELKTLIRLMKKSSITINGEPLKVDIKVNQDGDTTIDFYTSTTRERRPQAGANENKQEKEE